MIRVYVELSGESTALAEAESIAAAEALGGAPARPPVAAVPGLAAVDLPREGDGVRLAGRLALARRCLILLGAVGEARSILRSAGAAGRSAAVRRLGRPSAGERDASVLAAGHAFTEGGGTIDLEQPERRFWIGRSAEGSELLFEEIGSVNRRGVAARRMPALPFQRPVSLPPRLARAAANLARVRPGDRIVDPFVGTGALVAEAGLLGARIYGADRDSEMVRGSLRNLAHLGVTAEQLVVGDAGTVDLGEPGTPFDAVLTDPPYGRASSTGGEGSAAVVERVLPRWAARVRPGGRVVVIVSAPVGAPGPEWSVTLSVPLRVHRSLTREFRVYERRGPTAARTP